MERLRSQREETWPGFGLPDGIDDSFTTTVDLVIDAIATHSATQEARTPK